MSSLLSSRCRFRKASSPLLLLLLRRGHAHRRRHPSPRSFGRQPKAADLRGRPTVVGSRAGREGAGLITLQAPEPPGPEDCCASGCQECVWDVYEAELQAFHAAERAFEAPFVSRLFAEWHSPASDGGQQDVAATVHGNDEENAALEVLKQLPVLLGQSTPQTMENISRGLIVRSHELRKPHPDHDPQRFLRDICIKATDPSILPLAYRPADHAAIYSPNTPGVVERCLHCIVRHMRDKHPTIAQNAEDLKSRVVTLRVVSGGAGPNGAANHRHTVVSRHRRRQSESGTDNTNGTIKVKQVLPGAGANIGELTASVDTLLRWGCDLHRTTSQHALRTLAQFATHDQDAHQLKELARNATLYDANVARAFLGIVDVLEKFPSLNVPLEVLLQLSTPALPRKYSITSSPAASARSDSFSLLVSGHAAYGKCSSHFIGSGYRGNKAKGVGRSWGSDSSNCSSQTYSGSEPRPTTERDVLEGGEFRSHRVPFIFFQHFESDFPPIPQTLENHPPRIMVGAGSGVAPFLSMLREIDHVMAASGSASHSGGTMNSGNGEAKLPKIAAFFGFKSPNHDFLFQEQFEKWSRTAVSELGPVISYFFPVFSAAPNPAPLQDCRHVQDALLQQKELVADMLFGEGDFAGLPPSILLVCGSQDLAAGVEQSILAVVRSARPTWKPHQRHQFLQKLHKERRIVAEVWG